MNHKTTDRSTALPPTATKQKHQIAVKLRSQTPQRTLKSLLEHAVHAVGIHKSAVVHLQHCPLALLHALHNALGKRNTAELHSVSAQSEGAASEHSTHIASTPDRR